MRHTTKLCRSIDHEAGRRRANITTTKTRVGFSQLRTRSRKARVSGKRSRAALFNRLR